MLCRLSDPMSSAIASRTALKLGLVWITHCTLDVFSSQFSTIALSAVVICRPPILMVFCWVVAAAETNVQIITVVGTFTLYQDNPLICANDGQCK